MLELHLPWLELSILVPLIGALILGRGKRLETVYRGSLFVCFVTFALAVGEWWDFGQLHTFEAHDHWDLIHRFTSLDLLVVDELSAPLLPLTALVFLMIFLSTLPTKAMRFPFRGTLVSLALSMALLSTRDPWVLIMLLTLMGIHPWLNLRGRGESTRVYLIHTALMVALLVLGQAMHTFSSEGSLRALLGAVLLTVGCLVRSGIVPVHCWMTNLFERASFGVGLAYVAPMPGAYAAMRLVYPSAPAWVLQGIAVVSLITAIYAAGMALVQSDARRYFCYLFLSFSSLVLVGIELATPIGLTGALCIWLSVGLSLSGFGLAIRSIEARTGRLSLHEYTGLYEHTPKLAALFLLTGLASIGFPGTVGFIGTELLVEGAVTFYPLVGVAVVFATALNGIAILGGYFRVFTGTVHPASICLRARLRERVAILILAVFILGGGFVPQPGVASRFHAASALLKLRGMETSAPGAAEVAHDGSPDHP